MSNQNTKYCFIRRFFKYSKVILRLVYLVLIILEKLSDLMK